MSTLAGRSRFAAGASAALLSLALAWAPGALAVSVPVLSVSVNGGGAVSFEDDQVCEGTAPVTCLGTGSAGDLLISSFELTADPNTYVTGAFNFYNASASTISVVATILFPMTGSFAAPEIGLSTGLVNNVFGGGILNLVVEALVDPPGSPLAFLDEISPGVPFSVCEDLGADPGCQDSVVGLDLTQNGGSTNILSAIALRLSFDLSADTTATIGFDPSEPYNGAAYFSLTPEAAVPVPGAAWLLGGALAGLAGLRRRGRENQPK
jgi:hypothetical protein